VRYVLAAMPWDPYAPPTTLPDPAPIATTRLFGPVTIALVAALLNPVFGVSLAALNHYRRGDPGVDRRVFAPLPSWERGRACPAREAGGGEGRAEPRELRSSITLLT